MMRVIENSSISSVSASSENPNYPAENLLDEHPKRKWQAADDSVSSAVLTIGVSGRTGGMGMVGIVADAAAVNISDPNGISWPSVSWQNVEWVSVPPDLNLQVSMTQGEDFATLWAVFDQFDSAVVITVTLYKDAGSTKVLAAGRLAVGPLARIAGLQYPIGEDLVDYSLTRELSNGATYYRKRDIVRRFTGTLLVPRENDFYSFCRDLARKYGATPMMWNLVDSDGMEFVVYGRLASMPSGSHLGQVRSSVDFEILEVL
ncbi:MAG TPA: hypothetical protein ENK27_13455 [Desulfobulbus sp.]|nr:hypothetical protein [Desulfobulbus sp.]